MSFDSFNMTAWRELPLIDEIHSKANPQLISTAHFLLNNYCLNAFDLVKSSCSSMDMKKYKFSFLNKTVFFYSAVCFKIKIIIF